MTYAFILKELTEKGSRGLDEKHFLDGLLYDYKSFILYFPGIQRDNKFEERLTASLMDKGYDTLFNIKPVTDPNFQLIATTFNIRKVPIVIITAKSDYSLLEYRGHFASIYFKLDKDNIDNPSKAVDTVMKIRELFVNRTIYNIIQQNNKVELPISIIKTNIIKAITQLVPVENNAISVYFADGKFEIEWSEDTKFKQTTNKIVMKDLLKKSYDLLKDYNEQAPDIIALKESASNLRSIDTFEQNSEVLELKQMIERYLQSLQQSVNSYLTDVTASARDIMNEACELNLRDLPKFDSALNANTISTIDPLNLCLVSTICNMISTNNMDVDVLIRRCRTCHRRYSTT